MFDIPRSVFYGLAGLAYFIGLFIYRRYFHPLANVPGPALASFTKWYQTYWSSKYFEKIGELHEIYGPVVRICPNEVHLAEASNYDKIYYVGSNYRKDGPYYNSTKVPLSTFGALDSEVSAHCPRGTNLIVYRSTE
jgi:hypothetical protein